VSGAISPEFEKTPLPWFGTFEGMLAIRILNSERAYLTSVPLFSKYFPIGAGMAVRRKIIEGYYRAIANGSAYISGRIGTNLSSAEDIDLDFFAISQGFLVGTVGALKLTHIIPSNRTTVEYITRLSIASTKSIKEVNNKWNNVFSENVFNCFSISRIEISLKLLMSAFLYFRPRHKILFQYYKTLLLN